MNIGSFINMPVYDADFGWARPIFVGIGFPLIDRDTSIRPGSADDGSMTVTLAWERRHMEAFMKFFDGVIINSEDRFDQLCKALLLIVHSFLMIFGFFV